MYKTETHLHTHPVSPCSHLSAREMITRYHAADYTTVFVSDHFGRNVLERLGDGLTWNERIDAFLRGYEDARAAGESLGMHVLLSAELALGGDHFLLYGIDAAFLRDCECVFDLTPQQMHEFARAHGVTVVQAHPLRDGKCTPHPDAVDGFEAVNTNPRHDNFEAETRAIAAAYRLPVTAGSDAHRPEDIAGCAMLSDVPVTSGRQYVQLLLSGSLRPAKKEEIL